MARPKLPEKIKQIRGTHRKCRAVDDSAFSDTTVVALDSVKVPTHLSSEAKKIYKTVVSQLFAMKMLQPVDQLALCIFANAIATISQMQQTLDKNGYVIATHDKDGNANGVTVNPAQKVLKDAINTANTIGSQFGWSPQARMRLVAMLAPKKKKNEFSEFVNEE